MISRVLEISWFAHSSLSTISLNLARNLKSRSDHIKKNLAFSFYSLVRWRKKRPSVCLFRSRFRQLQLLIRRMNNPNNLVSSGTCTLILGRHLGFLKPDSSSTLTTRLAEAVRIHFTASRDAFYGLPLWKLLPTSAYKQLIESEDTIYKYVTRCNQCPRFLLTVD